MENTRRDFVKNIFAGATILSVPQIGLSSIFEQKKSHDFFNRDKQISKELSKSDSWKLAREVQYYFLKHEKIKKEKTKFGAILPVAGIASKVYWKNEELIRTSLSKGYYATVQKNRKTGNLESCIGFVGGGYEYMNFSKTHEELLLSHFMAKPEEVIAIVEKIICKIEKTNNKFRNISRYNMEIHLKGLGIAIYISE